MSAEVQSKEKIGSPMSKRVVVRELSIVVLGNDHNPTILNPDFLKVNNVVPNDWELAEPPVCAHPVASVSFNNGVRIVANINRITFAELFELTGDGEVETPGIAHRYIETLPHVEYRAVGINPKGHVVFETLNDAKNWFMSKFLQDGPWRMFNGQPADGAVKIIYTLDARTTLSLTADVGTLTWQTDKDKDKEEIHVVTFAANVHHDLVGESTKERLSNAVEVIDGWEKDRNIFQTIVDDLILESKE